MPTEDEGNTDGRNLGGDLQFANKPRIFPQRIKRMPQENKRNRRLTIHCPAHTQ